jgi:hypothetical protein
MPVDPRLLYLLLGKKSKREFGMRGPSPPKTPWDLKPVELHPGGDIAQIDEFSGAMKTKWNKGREEHGLSFKTDPFEEAMKECLDLALYAKVLYFRIKALKERTIGND